ncbi:MAG: beta strand repeat-containing protein [Nitrospirota bacterium]
MKSQWWWRAALVGLVLVVLGTGASMLAPSAAQAASCAGATAPCAEDPALDACNQCHSMTMTTGNRNGTDRPITLSNGSDRHILGPREPDFTATVAGMLSKGAAGIAARITAYLNTNYCTTCTGPILSSASLSNIVSNGVTISWTTSANDFADSMATSCVLYGTSTSSLTGNTCDTGDPNYDPNSATLVASHQVTLTGLDSLTEYFVVHQSTSGAQTTSYSLASSFTTPPPDGGGGGDGALGTIISLAVGNYDAGTTLDLGIGVSSKNHVIAYLGVGNGTFTEGQTLANVGTTPAGITTGGVKGDFNEDGLDDLAVVNFADGSKDVKVFLGTTPSGFETVEVSRKAFVDPPTSVVTGDFTGDGILDLAVATVHTPAPAMGHVLILPGIGVGGSGTGSFGDPIFTIDVPISVGFAPTITSITPGSVDCLGLPSEITITGNLLLNGSPVYLDGTTPLTVISYSANASIVARIPAGTSAGTHLVTVQVGAAAATASFSVTPRGVSIFSVTPSSKLYGVDPSGEVIISGDGFTVGGTVSIGPYTGTTVAGLSASSSVPFVFVNSTTIRVFLPSTQFPVGQYNVYVLNQDACGGTVTLNNGYTVAAPQPTISDLSDPNVTYGVSTSRSIRVNGTGFVVGAQLTVGGLSGTVVQGTLATAAQPFVFISSSSLAFYWGNTSLPVGSYGVTVTNPTAAGGLSTTLAGGFVVMAPQPQVSSVSISPVTYGVTPSLAVMIEGSDFLPGAVITVSNLTGTTVPGSSATAAVPFVFVSSSRLSFYWANTSLAPGTYHVRVDNPSAGGGLFGILTNGFVVSGAVPQLSYLTPDPVTYGVSVSSQVTIFGSDFVVGATITVGSISGQTVSGTTATSSVPFVFVSSGVLRFYWNNTSLPPGAYTVQVTNPSAAGGGSSSLVAGFTVMAPQPQIINLTPESVTHSITPGMSISVFGSDFMVGSTITVGALSGVTVAGSVATAATPFVFTSSGIVRFYWANTSLAPGVYNVQVTNPAPAGGLSGTLSSGFTVVAPLPTVDDVTPNPVTYAVTPTTNITIFGTNFVLGSTVTVGPLSGTTVAGTTATAAVPFVRVSSSQIRVYWSNTSLAPGSYTITIANPSATGGLAGSRVNGFTVSPAQPFIDPSTVTSATWGVLTSRAMNVFGSDFVVGATLTVGSLTGQVVTGTAATAAVPFVMISSGRLQFWWPNTSLAPGSYAVTVVNPAASGGLSATAPNTFVVTSPQPSIAPPLIPSPVTRGVTTSRAITIFGTDFTPGATISVGGILVGTTVTGSAATAAVPFVFVNSGRLSFWWNNLSLPVGSYDVTVTNAAGGGGLSTTSVGAFVVE